MGLETYKCECGQEFEDSEFLLAPECDECRTPRISTSDTALEQALSHASRFTLDELTRYYNTVYNNGMNTILTTDPTTITNVLQQGQTLQNNG